MSAPTVIPLVDEGLGNSSYLVDLGDGRALAVDPCRDLRAMRAAAERHQLRIVFAADTHLHADFLTGACQLAATDNATILASAAGGRDYDHHALRDGDEVDLGGLRLRALATPGHTDEHVSFLLLDGEQPSGVFTGGSLIVGSAARTDLVDAHRTEELARAQYASLHRLSQLPDNVIVWPTHGAGSFCSGPPGAARTSTIGQERATNPLLRQQGEAAFVAALLGSLGTFPPYFRHLGEINRRGPALLIPPLRLQAVSAERVARVRDDAAVIVDVRPIAAYAARHIPGSLSIELRDAFATWLGWLVPFDTAPIVLRDADQDAAEIAWQAAKVGYTLAGELDGGMAAWSAAGLPTTSTRLVTPNDIDGMHVLDIRQQAEYAAAHLPGASHIELGELAANASTVDDAATVLMCGHGERAMSAASLIEHAGGAAVAVMLGGPTDWSATHGRPLESGP
jgi:glyoxylase-like metal-dependent hydrolase (beta-lactamase superfamily II)/rhodanese-related sulfurtransferase